MNNYDQVDLKVDPVTQDISLLPNGVIDYLAGQDTVPNSFVRLLGTPPAGYARMVRTSEGVRVLNPDYESELPTYLSKNDSDILTDLEKEVRRATSFFNKIYLVEVELSKPSANSLAVKLYYVNKEDVEPQPRIFEATL